VGEEELFVHGVGLKESFQTFRGEVDTVNRGHRLGLEASGRQLMDQSLQLIQRILRENRPSTRQKDDYRIGGRKIRLELEGMADARILVRFDDHIGMKFQAWEEEDCRHRLKEEQQDNDGRGNLAFFQQQNLSPQKKKPRFRGF